MNQLVSHHPLVALAENDSREAREALVAATAEQFLDEGNTATLMERTLFSDILVKLYGFARQEVRLKLSAALAMADWAPVDLLRELALDAFEIAQPVISFCALLNDDILIEVVRACGFDHRMCVAERACIGERVCQCLIDTGDKMIMSALTKNMTARLSLVDFHRTMEALVDLPETLDAFVARHDLPPSLVAAAFAIAGAKARATILARVNPKISKLLQEVIGEATADAAKEASQRLFQKPLPKQAVDAVRTASQKLNVKPTPGVLVAALMRGEREHFVRGIASILDLPLKGVGAKLSGADIESLALATRAAQFNSSIVRTIYETLDTRSIPWSINDDRTVALVWMRCSPAAARIAFAKDMANE
ncbi:DUF2336 domain-containing protein [Candidatus Phycosocius spiralis]|nr:DUF2336 domain-containing protein [Candidatus Phycosocius spiralis]